jgi:hypothetical protein
MQFKTLAVTATIALGACHRTIAAPRYIAPEPRPIPTAARIRALVAELPQLEGYFTNPDHVYSLITDYRPIAELASADTAAILPLVACLRDTRRARIRYQGQRVSVGLVCAQVMLDTRYVERRLQYDCFPSDWPGVVTPTLDETTLMRAWQAWQQWLSDHPLERHPSGESPNDRCS